MTDLLIIGAGPGGYKAAVHAANLGLHVTIFEEEHVGGTAAASGGAVEGWGSDPTLSSEYHPRS